MAAGIASAVERGEMTPEAGQTLAASITADVATAEAIARTALTPKSTVQPIQDSGLSPTALAVRVLRRGGMNELDAHRKLAQEGIDAHAAIIVEENERILTQLNAKAQIAHDNSPEGLTERADILAAEKAIADQKLSRAKLLLEANPSFGFTEAEISLMSPNEIIRASGLEQPARFGDGVNDLAANLKAMEQSGGVA